MIHKEKPIYNRPKEEYSVLKTGEKLAKGDEYNSNGIWRDVPECLFGDKIPDCNTTEWRRSVSKKEEPKKKWYNFFLDF